MLKAVIAWDQALLYKYSTSRSFFYLTFYDFTLFQKYVIVDEYVEKRKIFIQHCWKLFHESSRKFNAEPI